MRRAKCRRWTSFSAGHGPLSASCPPLSASCPRVQHKLAYYYFSHLPRSLPAAAPAVTPCTFPRPSDTTRGLWSYTFKRRRHSFRQHIGPRLLNARTRASHTHHLQPLMASQASSESAFEHAPGAIALNASSSARVVLSDGAWQDRDG